MEPGKRCKILVVRKEKKECLLIGDDDDDDDDDMVIVACMRSRDARSLMCRAVMVRNRG